jgi:imidazolonepropionase-like amidohydrolase
VRAGTGSRGPRAGRPRSAAIAFALTAFALTTARAQTIAITGGKVYPVSGPAIENGTVLVRDGKIVAVGADVAVPNDATRIVASGKWVTP